MFQVFSVSTLYRKETEIMGCCQNTQIEEVHSNDNPKKVEQKQHNEAQDMFDVDLSILSPYGLTVLGSQNQIDFKDDIIHHCDLHTLKQLTRGYFRSFSVNPTNIDAIVTQYLDLNHLRHEHQGMISFCHTAYCGRFLLFHNPQKHPISIKCISQTNPDNFWIMIGIIGFRDFNIDNKKHKLNLLKKFQSDARDVIRLQNLFNERTQSRTIKNWTKTMFDSREYYNNNMIMYYLCFQNMTPLSSYGVSNNSCILHWHGVGVGESSSSSESKHIVLKKQDHNIYEQFMCNIGDWVTVAVDVDTTSTSKNKDNYNCNKLNNYNVNVESDDDCNNHDDDNDNDKGKVLGSTTLSFYKSRNEGDRELIGHELINIEKLFPFFKSGRITIDSSVDYFTFCLCVGGEYQVKLG